MEFEISLKFQFKFNVTHIQSFNFTYKWFLADFMKNCVQLMEKLNSIKWSDRIKAKQY